MSELRPASPVRRPASARRRTDEAPEAPPPSTEELEAIERHLVALPSHSGASVGKDDEHDLVLVHGPAGDPAFDYGGAVRWGEADWRARLGAFEAERRSAGRWPSLLVADALSSPPTLGERLASVGWREVERETAMWARHAPAVPHLDPWLRIEAVTPRSTDAFETLERAVFQLPERHAAARRAALGQALGSGGLRAYLVRVHGRPVAVARLSRHEALAGVYGVGVAPDARGAGLGMLVTTVAMRAGLALGAPLVWLSVDERNTVAFGLYRRLGFRPAFEWRRWLAPG